MSLQTKAAVVSACLFSLVIGALQWNKLSRFEYNALDLGIYTQTVWSLSQGHGFANSIHDPSYLGDHLELILVPIAAIYRFWPDPIVILWCQTLALAFSGFLLFRIGQRFLSPRGAILGTWLYFLHPFVYSPALYEFHGLTMALPLLLLAVLAYQDKRWWLWFLYLALAGFIREDLPLVAIGWALLGVIDRVPWKWWLAVGLFGVTWFAVSHAIITQANALDSYKYTAFVPWLGTTPSEILSFPFRHPLVFLRHIFAPNNWATLSGLLVGGGVIGLLRPKYYLPAVLLMLDLALIGSGPSSVLRLHYVIPFLPFLAWAAFAAIHDFQRGRIFVKFDRQVVMPFILVIALASPLYLHFVVGAAEQPWRRRTDADLTPPHDLAQAVSLVQPSDRVMTTFSTLPHLANRQAIYSINYVYLGRRQYSEISYTVPTPIDVAIIDWKQFYDFQFFYLTTKFQGRDGSQRVRDLLQENSLRLTRQFGSVSVYTRENTETPPLTHDLGPAAARPQNLSLIAAETKPDDRGMLVRMRWAVNETPKEPISIRFELKDSHSSFQTTRLLGEGGLPATNWRAGYLYETLYRLSISEPLKSRPLEVSWVTLKGKYRLDRLRTFRPLVAESTTLGNQSVDN